MSESNESDFLYRQAIRIASLIRSSTEKLSLTVEEQRQLEAWINASASNKELFELLQDRGHIATEVKALTHYNENDAIENIFKSIGKKRPSAGRFKRVFIQRIAVAASFLVLAGMGWWYFSTNSNHPINRLFVTVSTARGEEKNLTLADGSKVWLNAASSISYPTAFNNNKREVKLVGEGYFEVAKDSTKPFFVQADGITIQAIGTAFNVMAYDDEEITRVTLIEGKIKTGHKNREILLNAGESVTLNKLSGILNTGKANFEEATGWRAGKFNFNETNMPAIMRQIGRWYNMHVEYKGSIGEINFSGQISRSKEVHEVLEILSDTRKVHFEIPNDSTIVVIPGIR